MDGFSRQAVRLRTFPGRAGKARGLSNSKSEDGENPKRIVRFVHMLRSLFAQLFVSLRPYAVMQLGEHRDLTRTSICFFWQ
jgi:hypothetical protein